MLFNKILLLQQHKFTARFHRPISKSRGERLLSQAYISGNKYKDGLPEIITRMFCRDLGLQYS
jgi:hypothetical protein